MYKIGYKTVQYNFLFQIYLKPKYKLLKAFCLFASTKFSYKSYIYINAYLIKIITIKFKNCQYMFDILSAIAFCLCLFSINK